MDAIYLLLLYDGLFSPNKKGRPNKETIYRKQDTNFNRFIEGKNNIIQTQELIIKENQQQIIKKDLNLCFCKKKIKLLTKEKEEIKKDLSSITNALIEKVNEIEELNNLFF